MTKALKTLRIFVLIGAGCILGGCAYTLEAMKKNGWAITFTALALCGVGLIAWGVWKEAGPGYAAIAAGGILCVSLITVRPPHEETPDDKSSGRR